MNISHELNTCALLNKGTDKLAQNIRDLLSEKSNPELLESIKKLFAPLLNLAKDYQDLPRYNEDNSKEKRKIVDPDRLYHRFSDILSACHCAFDARIKKGASFTKEEIDLMKELEKANIYLQFSPKSSARAAHLRYFKDGKASNGSLLMSTRMARANDKVEAEPQYNSITFY